LLIPHFLPECIARWRLGLARAYVLQGDQPKARAAYEEFLKLWKEADPDVPVLRQAKAEYAKFR
jgi:cytochrome c-type biogenesis protein CcmH/NrfG